VIYLDSSVALAHLLNEERRPTADFWANSLVSSRLLEFEMLNVLGARSLLRSHETLARELLARVGILELIPEVIEHANSWKQATRTLDALHLSSLSFLARQGLPVELASYDERMIQAARKLKISVLRV
jgi:uncharacterized protein